MKTTIFDDENEYDSEYGTSLVDKLLSKSKTYELPEYDVFEHKPYEPRYDTKMGPKPMPYVSAVTPSLILSTHYCGGVTGFMGEYYDAPVIGISIGRKTIELPTIK